MVPVPTSLTLRLPVPLVLSTSSIPSPVSLIRASTFEPVAALIRSSTSPTVFASCPSVFRSTALTWPVLSVILMSLTSMPSPLLSDESKVARLTVCRASDPLSTLVTALLIAMPSAVAEFVQSPFATIKLLVEPPVVSVSTTPFRDELTAAVTPVACELIAFTTSLIDSVPAKMDRRGDAVTIRDTDVAQRANSRSASQARKQRIGKPAHERGAVDRAAGGGRRETQVFGRLAGAGVGHGKCATARRVIGKHNSLAIRRNCRGEFGRTGRIDGGVATAPTVVLLPRSMSSDLASASVTCRSLPAEFSSTPLPSFNELRLVFEPIA